ncbi:MAG: selenocysteine-specific elongation factor, partial [Thermoleophilaceae bacterium]|nr:selenocysteine-specific elongation factor [Thermoleophilaceae bacterium]
VARGVVAITKSDVADPEVAGEEAAELAPGAQIVPVAALKGDGLEELLAALERVAAETPSRAVEVEATARLHVDRSFTLKGIGTVVTGTLWSGAIGAGDQMEILPSGARARVRSVQVHDAPVERAQAGQRVAVNLVGVRRDEVARGDVLVTGGDLRPAFIVDARVELEPGVRAVDAGTRLHVHHGTRESPGRVYPLGGGFVQLRLEAPIVADRGDRLVLRRLAPPDTIGGGTVLDPHARRHGPRPEVVEKLRVIEAGGDPASLDAPSSSRDAADVPEVSAGEIALTSGAIAIRDLLAVDGERPRTDAELAAAAGVEDVEARVAFRALESEGSVVRVARSLHFDATALASLVERIVGICERDGSVTIAGVRDELDTSRKYAQALLEYLDGTRVTVRRGDEHVLRRRL